MKPNILFIFSDQHRAHALSCYGDPNIDTPHIDRLAAEGTRFNNAYSNAPICAPFRACLYTGQYITTHGVTALFKPLLPRQPVLPQVLQEHGYYTSHMGKWHLTGGDCPSHFVSPYFRPGWDEWLGWDNSNEPFRTEYGVGNLPFPLLHFEKYQTDAITDLTVEWLKNYDKGKPWFHVMSVEPPHPDSATPERPCQYEAPEEYMRLFRDKELTYHPNYQKLNNKNDDSEKNLRGYYAQIKNLDDNVGRVLKALEETGQLDNTIVVYFSDHGDMMGSHGGRQKSRPEEESTRIPFIIRWPGKIKPQVTDALTSGVDIMPTILGLVGVQVPESVEGTDISPVLRGERESVNDMTLIQFERSFFLSKNTDHEAFRTIRSGDWKYTVYLTQGPCQLYNITEDRYEMSNLIDSIEHVDIKQSLDKRLRAKCAELKDDFFDRLKKYTA